MDNLYYIFILIFGCILGFVLKSYLPSYFSEKGKNLATKEDIKEITQIVERVKIELSKDLEFVKWELGKKAAIHRMIAEKEIAAISEIGNALFDLKISTVSLRPEADYLSIEDEKRREEFYKRFENWAENHNLFLSTVEKHRLFLPKHLYECFGAIRELSAKEASSFDTELRYGKGRFTHADYKESRENTGKLIKAIDMTAQMIHQRYEIEGLEVLPNMDIGKTTATHKGN